jgi:hypothetical protein
MKIQLHIDKLRVEGVGPMSSAEMAALIEEQLNQIVEAHGVPPGVSPEGALALGNRTLRITPGLTRRQMGAEIAQRLMRDLYGPAGGLRPAVPVTPEPVAPAAPEAPALSAAPASRRIG